MTPFDAVSMRICAREQHGSRISTLYRAACVLAPPIVLLLLLAVYTATATAAVLLLGFLALAYVNYFLGGRDVLYPAFTFTAIWGIVAAVYCFCPIEIDPLGWRTITIFLGGGVCQIGRANV